MSNSPLITYTKLSPNITSPRNHEIDTISIHCTAGQGTAKSILNLSNFTKYDETNGSSCNYAIGSDGSIGLGVEEKNRSWCTSSRSNDHRAITIEVSSDSKPPYAVTDAAYKSLINLLVDICLRNNIKRLNWKADKSLIGQVDKQNMTVHRWFANKSCPGDYLYERHGQIASEVNTRLGFVDIVEVVKEDKYTRTQFVKDLQRVIGAAVDGIPGPETLSKTPTLSARKNTRHAAVKYVQKYLYALGYTEVGSADGIAGHKFEVAVVHFQRDNGCISDGEITARANTWKKLLGLL